MSVLKKIKLNAFILGLIVAPVFSMAEDEIPFEINNAIQEDNAYDSTVVEPVKPKTNNKVVVPQPTAKTQAAQPSAKPLAVQPDLAGLGKLAPFNDIAVITKRFLPKTNRFEVFPNFGLVLNDSFYNDLVMGGRVAFYFSEKYGLELTALSISTSEKTVTSELQNERFVIARAFATPTAYYGADFKWSPIYGKIGWMNKSIIPFDFYFSLGGGVTSTNQSTQPPTVHLGGGQMFALSKWTAVRWDISWYGYSSTSTVAAGGTTSTYSNLHATLGFSFFFPGAEYR